MALTITGINPTTGEATNVAYAKVTNFYGTKDQIQVQVAVYATKEARENNLQTIKDNAHYIGVADLRINHQDYHISLFNRLYGFNDREFFYRF